MVKKVVFGSLLGLALLLPGLEAQAYPRHPYLSFTCEGQRLNYTTVYVTFQDGQRFILENACYGNGQAAHSWATPADLDPAYGVITIGTDGRPVLDAEGRVVAVEIEVTSWLPGWTAPLTCLASTQNGSGSSTCDHDPNSYDNKGYVSMGLHIPHIPLPYR